MVRRNKPHSIHHYIRTRVEQLRAEKLKCRDHRDAQWYERLAQELEWCLVYKQSEEEER
jgi:hypothetical protein